MARDTFPYWPANWIQSPYSIVSNQVGNVIGNIGENRIPLQTDYTHQNVNLILVPRVHQDITNAAMVKGDSFQQAQGVKTPGTLFDRLMSSVPDPGTKP